jgi:RNA polymerase sigma factor (sigma-70 family)
VISDIGDLAREAKCGDTEALHSLMQVTAKIVYAKARSNFQDADAEDITQETLLRIIRNLPGLKTPSAYLVWVKRIASHVMADQIRSEKRLPQSDVPVDLLRDANVGPELLNEEREDKAIIRDALSRLCPRSQLVVELFYFRGLTCREVADFLEITHDATRAVLSRARKELRRSMLMKPAIKPNRTNRLMVVSGSSTIPGHKVLTYDSAAYRLYVSLYPAGSLQDALSVAELSEESADEAVSYLKELRLIRPEGTSWRCTMPIIGATDLELMLPWARRIAEPVLQNLEALFPRIKQIAENAGSDWKEQTVLLALLKEATRRPLAPIFDQMESSSPERGRYGSFRTAVFECTVPGGTYLNGGYGTSMSGSSLSCWMWPQALERPAISNLERQLHNLHYGTEIRIIDILNRFAWLPENMNPSKQRRLVTKSLGVPDSKAEIFWADLEEVRLVTGDGLLSSEIPVIQWAEWKRYIDSLSDIGKRISDIVCETADDLRRRASLCSFSDCNFDDCLLAFFELVEGLMLENIKDYEWLSIPDQADFAWGAMIAHTNRGPLMYEIGTQPDTRKNESLYQQLRCMVMPGNIPDDAPIGLRITVADLLCTQSSITEGARLKIVCEAHFDGNNNYKDRVQVRLVADGLSRSYPIKIQPGEMRFELEMEMADLPLESTADRLRRFAIEVLVNGIQRGSLVDVHLVTDETAAI